MSLAKYHKRVIKSISYGGTISFTQELSQENIFYSISVENNNDTLFYPNNIFRGQIKIQIYGLPFNTQVHCLNSRSELTDCILSNLKERVFFCKS